MTLIIMRWCRFKGSWISDNILWSPISSKELLRRQTDYLFDKPMTKPTAVKKEPVKDDMSVMMEKLVELNNGK